CQPPHDSLEPIAACPRDPASVARTAARAAYRLERIRAPEKACQGCVSDAVAASVLPSVWPHVWPSIWPERWPGGWPGDGPGNWPGIWHESCDAYSSPVRPGRGPGGGRRGRPLLAACYERILLGEPHGFVRRQAPEALDACGALAAGGPGASLGGGLGAAPPGRSAW